MSTIPAQYHRIFCKKCPPLGCSNRPRTGTPLPVRVRVRVLHLRVRFGFGFAAQPVRVRGPVRGSGSRPAGSGSGSRASRFARSGFAGPVRGGAVRVRGPVRVHGLPGSRPQQLPIMLGYPLWRLWLACIVWCVGGCSIHSLAPGQGRRAAEGRRRGGGGGPEHKHAQHCTVGRGTLSKC